MVLGFESGMYGKCFSSPKRPNRLWGQPILLIQWVPMFFPGGGASGVAI